MFLAWERQIRAFARSTHESPASEYAVPAPSWAAKCANTSSTGRVLTSQEASSGWPWWPIFCCVKIAWVCAGIAIDHSVATKGTLVGAASFACTSLATAGTEVGVCSSLFFDEEHAQAATSKAAPHLRHRTQHLSMHRISIANGGLSICRLGGAVQSFGDTRTNSLCFAHGTQE